MKWLFLLENTKPSLEMLSHVPWRLSNGLMLKVGNNSLRLKRCFNSRYGLSHTDWMGFSLSVQSLVNFRRTAAISLYGQNQLAQLQRIFHKGAHQSILAVVESCWPFCSLGWPVWKWCSATSFLVTSSICVWRAEGKESSSGFQTLRYCRRQQHANVIQMEHFSPEITSWR